MKKKSQLAINHKTCTVRLVQKQSIVTTLEESEATTKLKMIKYIVLGAAAVTSFVYAKSCECELGIYATNENGRCLGELKHFDTPEIAESCDVIFEDLKLSVISFILYPLEFLINSFYPYANSQIASLFRTFCSICY